MAWKKGRRAVGRNGHLSVRVCLDPSLSLLNIYRALNFGTNQTTSTYAPSSRSVRSQIYRLMRHQPDAIQVVICTQAVGGALVQYLVENELTLCSLLSRMSSAFGEILTCIL